MSARDWLGLVAVVWICAVPAWVGWVCGPFAGLFLGVVNLVLTVASLFVWGPFDD